MTLKPWYKVVKLHEDIRTGKFSQDQFAARLHDVLLKDKHNEYTDPRLFFDRTHITAGLESLLKEVLDRIEGTGNAPSVLQILTPFGGGKTHALLSLYHAVKNGKLLEDHPSLKMLRMERGKDTFPQAPVAIIDGNQLGADPFTYDKNIKIKTLWGHIAFQLMGKKGYEIVKEMDRDLRCPSGETIDKLLSACGKGLILLDEIVNYMESAATVKVMDSTLLFQTRTFLQILTHNASKHPNFVVAGTLPKSHLEVHGEASKNELERLKKIFSRVQNLREPVEGEEIYEIIRRRLFADTGNISIYNDVANAYTADYSNRKNLPEEVKKTDYREKFIKSYPFHPFLIDIFLRHVATNPAFQKTRGALRLLGLVVSDLWKKKQDNALIHAGDIDLNNNEIKNELVELVEPEYRNVLEADLIGKGANALMIDKENGGDHELYNVAQSLSTIAFLYTLEKGSNSPGASENELHLGIARPGLSKSVIFDSMRSLGEKLHFISVDGGKYKFTIKPNLTRIIFDEKTRGITEDDISKRIETEINNRIGRVPFNTYQWVKSSQDVPDTPQVKLILIPLNYSWGDKGAFNETEKFAMEIADHAGQGRRIYRNTLIFLFGDDTETGNLKEAITNLIALEKVSINKEKFNLTKDQVKELENKYAGAKQVIFRSILHTFRHTGWIGEQGNCLNVESRGRESVKEGENISSYVLSFLKDKSKYLESFFSILLLKFDKFKIWPPDEKVLHLKDLPNYFKQYTHLPILRDDKVLQQTIADGVTSGHFGYAQKLDSGKFNILKYKEKLTEDEVKLEEGYYIIRCEFADEIIKELENERRARKELERIERKEEPEKPVMSSFSSPGSDIIITRPEQGGTALPSKPEGGNNVNGPQKVLIDCEIPYDEFYNFFKGIIKPLGSECDSIKLSISLEAIKKDGFSATTIEDSVKETLFSIFKSENAYWEESI